jgi:hypothetical protein
VCVCVCVCVFVSTAKIKFGHVCRSLFVPFCLNFFFLLFILWIARLESKNEQFNHVIIVTLKEYKITISPSKKFRIIIIERAECGDLNCPETVRKEFHNRFGELHDQDKAIVRMKLQIIGEEEPSPDD